MSDANDVITTFVQGLRVSDANDIHHHLCSGF